MMDINYFLDDAQNSRQGQFELDFAEVITCFDLFETTLVTECGRTLVISWTDAGFFKSCHIVYETEQMESSINRDMVLKVIDLLETIDVDGETMQYILQRVGMEEQMLRQLVMSSPYTDTSDLLEEKVEQDNKVVGRAINQNI
jgi:hypothetical protein